MRQESAKMSQAVNTQDKMIAELRHALERAWPYVLLSEGSDMRDPTTRSGIAVVAGSDDRSMVRAALQTSGAK